jgi:acyl dehydratase
MRYYEDINVDEVQHSGPYELIESEITSFAAKWDPLPFHTDLKAAEESVFGGLAASNCHTVCIACKLLHETEPPAVLAALGHEYQYPIPVMVGDKLSLETRSTSKRESRSKSDRGIVQGETLLKNQDGDVVLVMKSTVMVSKKTT